MPPGPGGGGGRRGARTPNVREGNDDVRKFLSFYKRRNSVCDDLYLPAFYQKKPSLSPRSCQAVQMVSGQLSCW